MKPAELNLFYEPKERLRLTVGEEGASGVHRLPVSLDIRESTSPASENP